ncbi:MerR family transcriptional regulator [Streptomyces sp. NPDC093598]|uniref:MerR family transcriptional regulator n=1 Tax=Streptomyces sp. NPDC093598 TaxID=3366046 RepID=UPI003812C5E5
MGVHERDGEGRGREGAPLGGGLTTGEVARRLGVAPTTVRTWDRRYGLGPDAHTGGRHRRWTPADVARLERMCALTATGIPPAEAARTVLGEATPEAAPAGPAAQALPESARAGRTAQAPPETPSATAPGRRAADAAPRPAARARARSRAGSGLRLGDVRQECKGIARAALRLDAAALDELLEAAIDEHGLVAAWTEVIMPTLQAVGRKWESSGEKYVEVEHFLSWHVSGALRRGAPPAAADRPGATTVLACVPGENHTLPLEVLAAALAERGLPVRMFGGALPVESLVTAVRRTGPAAVGLWAQSRTTASRPLAQHVAAMEWGVRGARRKPVVLTIGPGWAGRSVTGLPRPTGLAEAVAVLESVVSR